MGLTMIFLPVQVFGFGLFFICRLFRFLIFNFIYYIEKEKETGRVIII